MAKSPYKIYFFYFATHFILLLISHFVDVKVGTYVMILNLLTFLWLLISGSLNHLNWDAGKNGMCIAFVVWGAYCIIEVFNPNTVFAAWLFSLTLYVMYPLLSAVMAPVCIRSYKQIEKLMILWSVFILLAVLKGYIQKNYGFSERELYFLYEGGRAKTHIIWSGIRFFSYFTDAANFGVHMAMALCCFGIASFFSKRKWVKLYFAIVAVSALYGMLISGTRAAVAVPLVGLAVMIVLSKNWTFVFLGIVVFAGVVFFFKGTSIGSGNAYIHKMRSAFKPESDASYNVRVINRQLMQTYMNKKPIGYGLGLSKSLEKYSPRERLPYPPDSWLIAVWVETGIVGLVLYLLIHAILFIKCAWILMFKLRNKRLIHLLSAWLCMNAGFFVACYANDFMQFPNIVVVYTGFALCFAGKYIEEEDASLEEELKIAEV